MESAKAEQKSAEERLRKEAEIKRLEEEEQLKIFEEERKKKEEEEDLMMMEEEKKQREENKQLEQMEEEQESQEVQSLADDSELKQEAMQNSQQTQESQDKQHEVLSLKSQQKQSKLQFDEENRLCEQLKLLQALKQQEIEQNKNSSKDVNLSVDDGVDGNETVSQKKKEKVTVANKLERQLHEQNQAEEETTNQQQLAKIQEEPNVLETQKTKNFPAHQNSAKTHSQQKQVKKKEAVKREELSKKKDEEQPKQEPKANVMNESLSVQKNKDTLLENKPPLEEKRNNAVQISTSAHAEHEMKSKPSTNHAERNVKYENSQSSLVNKVCSNTGSQVASQVQKSHAAKCQVKNSTSQESSKEWKTAVEAKRLKWMHECESWRYAIVTSVICAI